MPWEKGVLAGLVALALAPTGAHAATYHVTSTSDGGPGSLRAAVAAANGTPLEDDEIIVNPGSYRISSPLVVTDAVVIDGNDVVAGAKTISGQGITRVFEIAANGADSVTLRDLTVRDGRVSGNGGGILHSGSGSLTVQETTVTDNIAAPSGPGANGGGGIYDANPGALTVIDSTISRNRAIVSGIGSGGGGLFVSGVDASMRNSTISGNTVQASGAPTASGGGGYFTTSGGGVLNNVTLVANFTEGAGVVGGAFRNNSAAAVSVSNTILANGSAPNCFGTLTPQNSNLENATTCGLDPSNGDIEGVAVPVEPLEANGGPTPTHALTVANPGINQGNAGNPCEDFDQRGVGRFSIATAGCDIGAFEFDGAAQASIPDCTRSGQIPVSVTAAPDSAGVEAIQYKVDGGPTQTIDLPNAGSSTGSATISVPEGRRRLEYWGDYFPEGPDQGGQLEHHTPEVVVDRTNPTVAVENPNRFKRFVITRRVRVDVKAADSISGLTSNPSGRNPIATRRRGLQTYAPTATDLCDNKATEPFTYRVLAPSLGKRIVLEPLTGRVRVRSARAGGARASQKGRSFGALREPRELPIRSLVDARRGTARLTTARRRALTSIQDGRFSGSLFQVLQSRRRGPRGLTSLALKGASFKACGAAGKGASAAARRIRRLRGNARGRFRTRGRHSAATVRGTIWTVTDRCDGTLTQVRRGRVAVRDFRLKKTIVVRAGKRYLARAHR